ncbi:MAG: GNAT family N-acetyltransferase [Verrucomicrobia bacterium]|nr:GNAT family N-acetyltransferase [Verrucomicrobiota bacterium]
MQFGQTPFLSWHVDGDKAWIDFLFVPRHQRRKGYGTDMLNKLVAELPPGIRVVTVLSAQLDDEFSPLFWRKSGFEPVDDFGELLLGSFMQRPLGPRPSAPARPSSVFACTHSGDDPRSGFRTIPPQTAPSHEKSTAA